MKKRLVCLLIAVLCLIPLALTGCGEDEPSTDTGKKAMTITLYGITNESTTEEAIKLVQDELNLYTEGQFNTHIILRLYPESEYYAILDEKLAAIKKNKEDIEAEKKRKKEEERARKAAGLTVAKETTVETVETEADTYIEHGATKTVYPDENGQVDIFMVQGAANLNKYYDAGYLSSLSDALTNSSKLIAKYISPDLLTTTTLGGTGATTGLITGGSVYGIPNNTVSGEYTYLLINKELADKYYYKAEDVSTLSDLANFLDDVATNDKEIIPLYNEPHATVNYLTSVPSLIGGMYTNNSNVFTMTAPRDILNISSYSNSYLGNIYKFNAKGYIVDNGDDYNLPEDQKVAAAFIKGDYSTPELYEDDYYVVTYAKPLATAEDRPGTAFCVSSYTSNVDRCMEIISALTTVSSFRNTFQYGVEGVNYTVNEYTELVDILNDTYSMNPADTGNMFILSPNSSMSAQMLKYAENNWYLGKMQSLDTITGAYSMFNFKRITAENYETTSRVYAEARKEALDEAKKNPDFKESEFTFSMAYPYMYTDEMLDELVRLSNEYMDKLKNFKEYVDEDGETVVFADYIKIVRTEFEKSDAYAAFIDTKNIDSPYKQYVDWYSAVVPATE